MLGNRLIHDLEESPMRTPKKKSSCLFGYMCRNTGSREEAAGPPPSKCSKMCTISTWSSLPFAQKPLYTEAVLRDTLTLTFVYFVSTRSPADYFCSDFSTMLINSDWRSKDQKTDLFSKEHEMVLELKTHAQVFMCWAVRLLNETTIILPIKVI